MPPRIVHSFGGFGRLVALVACAFGALTIVSGGRVLFGSEAARAAAGNVVPFVVWVNFLAGFAYVAAGAGLWLGRRWSVWLAIVIAATTTLVFAALGIHIASGGAFEVRTVAAMALRTMLWTAIAMFTWRRLLRDSRRGT